MNSAPTLHFITRGSISVEEGRDYPGDTADDEAIPDRNQLAILIYRRHPFVVHQVEMGQANIDPGKASIISGGGPPRFTLSIEGLPPPDLPPAIFWKAVEPLRWWLKGYVDGYVELHRRSLAWDHSDDGEQQGMDPFEAIPWRVLNPEPTPSGGVIVGAPVSR